jgi:hypothetical protein
VLLIRCPKARATHHVEEVPTGQKVPMLGEKAPTKGNGKLMKETGSKPYNKKTNSSTTAYKKQDKD